MQQTSHNPFAAEATPWRAAYIKEAYTVFFNVESTPYNPINYKEKDIYTKSGEKNAGLFASEQASILTGGAKSNEINPVNSRKLEKTEPMLCNQPQQATFVTLEAESAEEALQALRVYYSGYGSALVAAKGLGCKSSELKEVNLQP